MLKIILSHRSNANRYGRSSGVAERQFRGRPNCNEPKLQKYELLREGVKHGLAHFKLGFVKKGGRSVPRYPRAYFTGPQSNQTLATM